MGMLSGEVATSRSAQKSRRTPGHYLAHRPDSIGQLLLRVVTNGIAIIGHRSRDDAPGPTI
jgi:hypothetical protein